MCCDRQTGQIMWSNSYTTGEAACVYVYVYICSVRFYTAIAMVAVARLEL